MSNHDGNTLYNIALFLYDNNEFKILKFQCRNSVLFQFFMCDEPFCLGYSHLFLYLLHLLSKLLQVIGTLSRWQEMTTSTS